MHSPEIKAFIRHHSDLFWYTPEDKKEHISEEFLVETILNYGDIKGVRELFRILGKNRVAEIFYKSIQQSARRKANYNELVLNFFNLVFKKDVS